MNEVHNINPNWRQINATYPHIRYPFVYLWLQADDLRLLPDEAGVADGQTVQQVHQHHHHQEDEGHEQQVADGVRAATK